MKKRAIIGLALVLLLIIGWRLIPIPGTLHFAGDGKHFGAGVNTTSGLYSFKDLELVIYSKPLCEIKNIKYELKGLFGLKSSGVVATGSNGYYIGSIAESNKSWNISKFDVITLTLEWNNQKEVLKISNVD